ncbi:MAG: hypothetical protein WKG07_41825 [Hymenobacter sp.]
MPLLWIDHVRRGQINWPNARDRRQYLDGASGKKAGLLPVRNYVLLRRFSAKDDKHRLIAAPLLAADWSQYAAVGLENKLNYLYARRGQLTDAQTAGLAALLNSNLYDAFFRIFNGNTQVSATEARALPMPELATIEEIGRQALGPGQQATDAIVNRRPDPLGSLPLLGFAAPPNSPSQHKLRREPGGAPGAGYAPA